MFAIDNIPRTPDQITFHLNIYDALPLNGVFFPSRAAHDGKCAKRCFFQSIASKRAIKEILRGNDSLLADI